MLNTLNPLTDAEWDSRLAGFPHAGVFHTRGWASTLQAAYNLAPYYLADNPATPRWILPVMEVPTLWGGRKGISLPFTDACEPVSRADGEGDQEVIAASTPPAAIPFSDLLDFARSRRWGSIELRGGSPPPEAVPSMTYFVHSLCLEAPSAALFQGFPAATRRAIRKAEKNGVAVTGSADLDALEAYYEMHCRTRRRHGAPPQPIRFFRSMWDSLIRAGQGIVFTAWIHARPIAAAVFLWFRSHAVFKFGASDPADQDKRPNNLVFWHAIQWLRDHGCSDLHLGRTSLHHHGLVRFKRGWNVEEKIQNYYRYDLRRQTWQTDRDPTDGWYTEIFRRLPLPVTRAAGNFLYPRMG